MSLNMNTPGGVSVESVYGRSFLAGGNFQFPLGCMRFAIAHPEHPGEMILFGIEDVTVLFHPDFRPESGHSTS